MDAITRAVQRQKRREKMNIQCNTCIHKTVCAYKEHYEDVETLYEKAKAECGKYPWFKFKIECVQYHKEEPSIRTALEKMRGEE